jgi:hypothetical protein
MHKSKLMLKQLLHCKLTFSYCPVRNHYQRQLLFSLLFCCFALAFVVLLFSFFFCLTRRTISPKGFITTDFITTDFYQPLLEKDVINYLKLERTTLMGYWANGLIKIKTLNICLSFEWFEWV